MIALFVSSWLLMRQVSTEFAQRMEVRDQSIIKCAVFIFVFGFSIRIVMSLIFAFAKSWVSTISHYFNNRKVFYIIGQEAFWLITELMPIGYLLWVHYRNFSSDNNREIESEFESM